MDKSKRVPRLENWCVHNFGTMAVAEGNVFGDPRFQDGQLISTSYIKQVSYSEGKITTKNNFYYLGTPATTPIAEDEIIIKKEDK
jgi:hypothetical protein